MQTEHDVKVSKCGYSSYIYYGCCQHYTGLKPIDSTIWYYALVECASSMNFTGCVGSLMAGSGLVDNMSCACCGVDHNVDRKERTA